MISLSLIIPTYNRGDLVADTIRSALDQTRPFDEIIVVDDGSTDDTQSVLAQFGERIRVILCSNGGVQEARNIGMKAATGEYIVLCDSDDLLANDFVSAVAGWLEAHPDCDAVYTNLVKFTGSVMEPDDFSGAPTNFMDGAKQDGDFFHDIPDLYQRLFTLHPFYISGCTIRKTLVDSLGGFDVRFKGIGAEDGEFTLRVAVSGKTAYCTKPLAKVRRHDGNDSADPFYMMMGSAHILEFAATHHLHAARYRAALLGEASRLRIQVIDKAFSQGNFDMVRQVSLLDFVRPAGLRFRLKLIIASLPEPLRTLTWKVTQA